jgi:hypothetical protein
MRDGSPAMGATFKSETVAACWYRRLPGINGGVVAARAII